MFLPRRPILFVMIAIVVIMIVSTPRSQEALAQSANDLLAVEWSPDGNTIAVSEREGGLSLVDSTSSTVTNLTDLKADVFALVWSPDGKYLAAVTSNRETYIWDVTKNEIVVNFTGVLLGYPALAWSLDGTTLAMVGTKDESAPLQIWTIDREVVTSTFTSYNSAFLSLAWQPNGDVLAVGRFLGVVIFESSDATFKDSNLDINTPVTALTWSPDGTRLFLGDLYGMGYIFDFTANKVTSSFTAHNGMIIEAIWSPDGTRVASVGADLKLKIWNAQTVDQIEELSTEKYPIAVSWSPFGGRLAYGLAESLNTPLLSLPDLNVQSSSVSNLNITVPTPTIELLTGIAEFCVEDTEQKDEIIQLIIDGQLDELIAELRDTTTAQLAPACAADLIAVAEAILAKQ